MQMLERMLKVHKITNIPQEAALYRDILEYYGYQMSPLAAFAASCGLGFEYYSKQNIRINFDYVIPCRYIGGYFSKDRRKISKRLGIWLEIYKNASFDEMLIYVRRYISIKRPVILKVNVSLYWDAIKDKVADIDKKKSLFELPNYTYINGYFVCVIGIDLEDGQVVVLDSKLKEPVTIPLKKFSAMCKCKDENLYIENEWIILVVPERANIASIEEVAKDSIQSAVREMLYPYNFGNGYWNGLRGITEFVKEFPTWDKTMIPETLLDSIRMIHFNSEVVCGSTGLYRKTFADFLEEYIKISQNENFIEAAKLYRKAGENWTFLLNRLYSNVSDEESFHNTVSNVIETLDSIATEENAAILSLAKASGSDTKYIGGIS